MLNRPRDQISKSERDQRLTSILTGAFGGPPTPLKEIPKRDGKPRSQAKDSTHPNKLESGIRDRGRKDQRY